MIIGGAQGQLRGFHDREATRLEMLHHCQKIVLISTNQLWYIRLPYIIYKDLLTIPLEIFGPCFPCSRKKFWGQCPFCHIQVVQRSEDVRKTYQMKTLFDLNYNIVIYCHPLPILETPWTDTEKQRPIHASRILVTYSQEGLKKMWNLLNLRQSITASKEQRMPLLIDFIPILYYSHPKHTRLVQSQFWFAIPS